MFRKALPGNLTKPPAGFNLRGLEVKRIETFSDAVFAFAVTLLIVSLEVPKSFEELAVTMRGFFAFGVCFTLLMFIWHEQHIFFRRYGMDDTFTIFLNSSLIFIVLFYVYPLKFLFTVVFSQSIYGHNKSPFFITEKQAPYLMIIYGVGYIVIYLIFFLLYYHAHRNKEQLQLTRLEQFDTFTKIYSQLILISIGILSVIIILLLPQRADLSGLAYGLIGIALTLYYRIRARMRKKIHSSHKH